MRPIATLVPPSSRDPARVGARLPVVGLQPLYDWIASEEPELLS